MKRQMIIPAVAAGVVLAAVCVPLLAQSKGQSQASQHKQIIKLMDEAEMTLAKAVEAAEKESAGRAVGVRADLEGEKLVLTVSCSVGEELKLVTVDKEGKATVRGGKKDASKDKKDEGKPKADPTPGGNPRQVNP